MHSPRRTPSPMECALYNIPPPQAQQNLACQLQPIMVPQGPPSPMLIHDPVVGSRPTTNPDTCYPLGDTSN